MNTNSTPLWDGKVARATFTVALVVAAWYGIFLIRRTLFIFVLAVFLAYIVYPLVRTLHRVLPRRVPAIASPIAAFVLLLGLLVSAGVLIGPSLMDQATTLTDRLPALLRRSGSIESWPWPDFMKPYADRIAEFIRTQLESGTAAAIPIAQRIGTGILQVAGNLFLVVLIPVLAFLFIVSGPRIDHGLRAIVAAAHTNVWEGVLDDLHHLVGGYMRALFLLSLCAFAAYALFLSLIGVPYALLLATVASILEYVPVFGPLIAAILMIAVAGLSSFPHVLWILAFIILYRGFQDYVLGPRLMGDSVGVHPILVIFGLLAGEQLGGVAGIFLSVPVIAAAMIIARHLMRSRRTDNHALEDARPDG